MRPKKMQYQVTFSHLVCDYHEGKWESKITIADSDGHEVAVVALYAGRKIHTPVLQSIGREVCDLLRGAARAEALEQ